jgi:hypothetical protein
MPATITILPETDRESAFEVEASTESVDWVDDDDYSLITGTETKS